MFGSVFEVGMGEGDGVAHGGVDGDAEEVADPADVAAGGVDLLEDAVFSQGLGPEACSFQGNCLPTGSEPWAR